MARTSGRPPSCWNPVLRDSWIHAAGEVFALRATCRPWLPARARPCLRIRYPSLAEPQLAFNRVPTAASSNRTQTRWRDASSCRGRPPHDAGGGAAGRARGFVGLAGHRCPSDDPTDGPRDSANRVARRRMISRRTAAVLLCACLALPDVMYLRDRGAAPLPPTSGQPRSTLDACSRPSLLLRGPMSRRAPRPQAPIEAGASP